MPPKQARAAQISLKKLLAGAAALLTLGSAGVAVAASPSPARLRDFVCKRNLDPAARAMAVDAVMRPRAGTMRMWLRFDLLQRKPQQQPYTAVRAGDLGRWMHPANPTLGQRPGDTWIYDKRVIDLPAPAWYRFRVTFRWTGTDGRPLGRTVRMTRTCYQPELRPDLLVASIAVQPLGGQQDAYTAVIANDGATGAGPFQVQFTDAAQSQHLTVRRLPAHASVAERFVGAVCTAGNAPTVTVDPNLQVDDYNRSNNTLEASCSGGAMEPLGRGYTW